MKSILRSYKPLLFLTGLLIVCLSSCSIEEESIPDPTKVKDYDGNEYTIIQVGEQVWLKENLKTTHYNDGTPIAHLPDNELWIAAETGAYSWYDNDPENKDHFGALYNVHVAKSGKICPTGWRVPKNIDWFRLEHYASSLFGATTSNLRDEDDLFWNRAEGSFLGTNRTGFYARGSGVRDFEGYFVELRETAGWWVAEENFHAPNWGKIIHIFDKSLLNSISDAHLGLSIRCIKSN
jgi:uncharacterized protein (TIGR02145 family)